MAYLYWRGLRRGMICIFHFSQQVNSSKCNFKMKAMLFPLKSEFLITLLEIGLIFSIELPFGEVVF